MLRQYLKRGFTNSFCFGATTVLAKGVWLVSMPYILSLLSITDVGIFDFYQSIFLIGSLVIASVGSIPLGRFYLKNRNEPELQTQIVGTSIRLVLFCALLCLAFSFMACIRYALYGDSYFIIFLMVNAGLFSCFSLVTSFAQIRERLKEYTVLYCAQNFCALSIALVSLNYGYGISSLFWANGVSYIICLPIFIHMFWHAGAFEKKQAEQLLRYGMPLMIYNVLYMLLFSIDRWYIKVTFGYELLGIYAVLWYFGRIFQYVAMALYDASPMLLYNAQHEAEGTQIIARVLRYVAMLYTTGALLLVPFAYIIITWFLPVYSSILLYVPFFIMPLLLLEMGRFWQAGFTLATQTKFVPLLSFITLLVQCSCLYALGPFGLPGILGANCIAFSCYALMNALGSAYIYDAGLFDSARLFRLFGFYIGYNLLLWQALYMNNPSLSMFAILATWPPALWFGGVLAEDERLKILQIFNKNPLVST